MPKPSTVDTYLAAQPESARRLLQRLRTTIRKAVPGAAELIAYGMPGYKLDGAPLLYFACWKQHLALYPGSRSTFVAFKDALAAYETDKGTIRFPLDAPIDVKLVAALAKWRADEVRAKVAMKKRATKPKLGTKAKVAKKPITATTKKAGRG